MVDRSSNSRRVVVTGMGVVSPVGFNVSDMWQSLVSGKSGIDYITSFDPASFETKFAAEIKGFDPSLYVSGKEARRMDRFAQFAAAASLQAVEAAGLKIDNDIAERYGVVIAQYYHRLAYTYWINGYKEKAEYYFDRQIEASLEMINSNRPWASKYFTYYDLAGVYAFRGEKEKAYENLRIFNRIEDVPLFMVTGMKRDELFESIRNEPEFQQIKRDIEAKYQAGHERVRQWLEENGMF